MIVEAPYEFDEECRRGRDLLIRFTYPLASSESFYKYISWEITIISIKGVLEQVDGKHKFLS